MYLYTWHFRINIFGSAEGSKRSSFWKVPNSWADIWIWLEWVRERENQVWKRLIVITQYLFYSFPFAVENSIFFNFNFLTPKTFCIGVQPINIVELLKQSPKFQVNNSNFWKLHFPDVLARPNSGQRIKIGSMTWNFQKLLKRIKSDRKCILFSFCFSPSFSTVDVTLELQ